MARVSRKPCSGGGGVGLVLTLMGRGTSVLGGGNLLTGRGRRRKEEVMWYGDLKMMSKSVYHKI